MDDRIRQLEAGLNDFDAAVRCKSLEEILALAAHGHISLAPEKPVANMHCHTFFSFNAYGFSPTALAWLAKREGFKLIGIVDFDVLDGVDEFMAACDLAGVRGTAGMETRVVIPEFLEYEINSPGEPGIAYHMGIGFTSSQVPEDVRPILDDMRVRAERRNRAMLERLNDYLAPITIDYDQDVLPLTPSGNATERHMLTAILDKVASQAQDVTGYWAQRLRLDEAEVSRLMGDRSGFQNLVRARLMKRGGVGYVQPTPESFPTVDECHRLIVACGALPCAAWLDGTSAGEQRIGELLELLIGKGVVALNIVPDRNWNIADPGVKEVKLRNLYDVVRIASELNLPLNVGTEMNSPGQKWVDDFDAPELAPVRQAFLDGAHFVYGHTMMQRALSLGYQSDWAKRHLADRAERNAFYTQVGYRVPPGPSGLRMLREIGEDVPDKILGRLGGSAS